MNRCFVPLPLDCLPPDARDHARRRAATTFRMAVSIPDAAPFHAPPGLDTARVCSALDELAHELRCVSKKKWGSQAQTLLEHRLPLQTRSIGEMHESSDAEAGEWVDLVELVEQLVDDLTQAQRKPGPRSKYLRALRAAEDARDVLYAVAAYELPPERRLVRLVLEIDAPKGVAGGIAAAVAQGGLPALDSAMASAFAALGFEREDRDGRMLFHSARYPGEAFVVPCRSANPALGQNGTAPAEQQPRRKTVAAKPGKQKRRVPRMKKPARKTKPGSRTPK